MIRTAEAGRVRSTSNSQLLQGRDTDGDGSRFAKNGTGSGNLDLGGVYTGGFPDSTRGTALVSPPDKGTMSPLDWQPGVDFSHHDFAKREFLKPSLQANHRHGIKGRGNRANTLGRQRRPYSSLEYKQKGDLPNSNLPPGDASVPSILPSLPPPVDQR